MTSDTGKRTSAVGSGISSAADKVRDRASAARSRAGAVYGSARDGASRARRRTAEEIGTNPVAALLGGLAFGALAAAIIPGTRNETKAFGKFGRRINDRALESLRAAREAGADKLDELGINRDAAKRKLDEIADNAGEAMRSSAGAAAEALKGSRRA